MNDEESLIALGQRLAQVRLQLNQTQSDLATAAGISRATVQRLEAGQSSQLTNLLRVLRALRLPALHEAIPGPSIRPLEILEGGARRRRRASRAGSKQAVGQPWTWSEDA